MSEPISVSCPHCKSTLKLKSSSAVGKKVPCPKCQKPFVVALPKQSAAPKPVASSKQPVRKKPKPADDEDVLGDLGDLDEDYGGDEDVEEADDDSRAVSRTSDRKKSGANGSSSKKGSQKKKQAAKPAQWKKPALIGGGAALVVLLLVLLFLFLRPRGEAPAPAAEQPAAEAKVERNKLNLAYLPPDAELVVHVRMTEVWNAPLVKQFLEGPDATAKLNELKAASPEFALLEPAKIESVTVGTAGLSASTKYQREQIKVLGLPDLSDPSKLQANLQQMQEHAPKLQAIQQEATKMQHTITVVRMMEPLSKDQVSQTLAARQSLKHQETTYYLIPSPQPGGIPGSPPAQATLASFLPDQSTVVVGSEADVKSAIERGAKEARRADLDFVDPEQHVLLAFVPKDATLLETADGSAGPLGAAPGLGFGSMPNLLPDAFKSSMKTMPSAFSLGVAFTTQIGLQLRGNCTSDAVATAGKSEVEAALKDITAKFAEKKEPYSKQFPNIIQTAQTFVDSIAVKQDGTTIEVTASLPETVKAASKEFLPFMLAMSLSGGLNQPQSPPASLGTEPPASLGTETPPALNPATLNPGSPPAPGSVPPGAATTSVPANTDAKK